MYARLPEPVRKLSDQLAELPSIGPRQAVRLALFLVAEGPDAIRRLSDELKDLERVKLCSQCFFVHVNPGAECDICRDQSRKQDTIAIIEKETDLLSIENTKLYAGRYMILGPFSKTGILDDGQKLRLQNLKSIIEKKLGGKAAEIILALNQTAYGDLFADILEKELRNHAIKISRMGRGLPRGGEIEFADDETLGSALEQRK